MYTCCPICKTNFKVTEAQLQVAQGKVRCGSCKNVFNARQHIHYAASNPTQATQPPSAKVIKKATHKTSSLTTESSKNKTAQSNQPHQTKNDSKKPITEIDKIFNALDTQLTKGTYIDIAKTNEPDIREAAFNDIFDDDEFNDTDSTPLIVTPTSKDVFLKPQTKTHNNHDEIDLNLYEEENEEPVAKIPNEKTDHSPAVNQEPKLTQSFDDPALQKTLDNISTNNKGTHANKQKGSNKQQHAFDFINLPDETDLSLEAEEQLAAVNTPLEMPATNKLITKTDNDELHQAIDNIIKVNNSITTPYEENDADHFVIEVQSEPDVELVDENDIDKLFASTDSLKISDLKFSPNKIKPAEDKLKDEDKLDIASDTTASTQNDNDNSININVFLDDVSKDQPTEIEPNLNIEANAALIENDFDDPNFEHQAKTFDPDDSDIIDLETEFDESSFDEEIILSSEAETDIVPHRLRDAVASYEQEPISIKKRLFYSVAAILLIGLAGLQLVIFKSTAAANTFPLLQPLLVSMCQQLPCRYTGNHNRKQIKIINRDVRLHPKIKGALLISATIANQASYTQPYPTILLKFTDLTGATVAQRYFQPTEYLGQLNKPFALMPSKKPVQLNIEILDPGSEAINFQFFFL